MKDIQGNPVKLSRYEGSVVMVVNVASKCGNTPQYKSLEALYEKYKNKGLVVLGFPANDFGAQEPGTDKEIKEFCEATYKVQFPMFSKISVKGDATAPLYKFLTDKATNPKFDGPIEWNFDKFIIGRNGEVVGRVKPGTDPMSNSVVMQLEKALASIR
nr:glutathione peroxidase [Armatimonas sp.]